MPAAPRQERKATKIAYKILGVPGNIAYKPSEFKKRLNRKLISEETARVR